MIEAVRARLEHAVLKSDPPAAACCVIKDGTVIHASCHATVPGAVFDVASVTKIVATTSAVAILLERGEIHLDDALRSYLPAFRHDEVTVRALLGHRSGLPAWRPYFAGMPGVHDRAGLLARVLAEELEVPGRRVYSDLGFILLGELVKQVSGVTLDTFCRKNVWDPFGIADDIGFARRSVAQRWLEGRTVLPTGETRPREPAPGQEHLYEVPEQARTRVLAEVDDDNAFVMGGVSGHAGVFATAPAIARFGAALLRELDGEGPLGIGSTLETLVAIDPADGPERALGFDVPARSGSSAGTFAMGPGHVFGHLGFTGCSLWVNRGLSTSVALLTNRTLLGRHRLDGIRALRPRVHDAVHAHLVESASEGGRRW